MKKREFTKNDSLQKLKDHIRSCLAKGREFHSCCSLVQSSGFGKTALLAQLSQEYLVLYLNFAESGAKKSSVPGQNLGGTYLLQMCSPLQSRQETEKRIESFFERALIKGLQGWSMNPETFRSDDNDFWMDVPHQTLDTSILTNYLPTWRNPVIFAFDEARVTLASPEGTVSLFRMLRQVLSSLSKR